MRILKNAWTELYHGFITVSFGHFMKRPESWKKGSKDLILIQGINESYYCLSFLASHFNSKGYKVHTPLSGLLHDDIEVLAQRVMDYIAEHHIKDFEILAHSKGGLVGKHVLDQLSGSGARIRLWSLSTPFKGMYAAHIPIWNLKQMKTSHEFIANLYNNKETHQNVISIYPRFDQMIFPASSAHLEDAQNYEIKDNGHLAVCFSQETVDLIDEFIT
jgi:triacylglycerol lipase